MNHALLPVYPTAAIASFQICLGAVFPVLWNRIHLLLIVLVTLPVMLNCAAIAQFDGGVAYTAGKDPNAGRVSNIGWDENGSRVSYKSNGRGYVVDLQSMKVVEQPIEDRQVAGHSRLNETASTLVKQQNPGLAVSSTGRWIAKSENGDVFIEDSTTGLRVRVTSDGAPRLSNGFPNLELERELPFTTRAGVWWSRDESHLLFAKFDSTRVNQYHMTEDLAKLDTTSKLVDRESPGSPTSTVQFFLYELKSKTTTRLRIEDGSRGHVFDIRAAPGGQMLCSWTNREYTRRKELIISPSQSTSQTIVEVKHAKPLIRDFWRGEGLRFLKDKQRFLWLSYDSGYRHYELRSLDGKPLNPVTSGHWDVDEIVFVDETSGNIGFTAYSSSVNPYFCQFHIAKLDGSKSWRVTKQELHHGSFVVSPDHKWLISTYEGPNTPPCTSLHSMDGSNTISLAEYKPRDAPHFAETFKFRSSDGRHDLHGILFKPADYDPERQYPVIAMPYGLRGGPTWWPVHVGSPLAINRGNGFQYNRNYIFLQVNNRGTMFRGREFVDAAYGRLFTVGAQDYADAIKSLRGRSDMDFERVGIVGHSFGGGLACLALLQHPDIFCVGVAKSGVMDWRNQAAAATVRFGMGTIDENPEGYECDSPLSHAHKLKRPFLLMHGMLDTRVFPNSAFMMSNALDQAGLDYEMKLYPNAGHGLGPPALARQWEFLETHLLGKR